MASRTTQTCKTQHPINPKLTGTFQQPIFMARPRKRDNIRFHHLIDASQCSATRNSVHRYPRAAAATVTKSLVSIFAVLLVFAQQSSTFFIQRPKLSTSRGYLTSRIATTLQQSAVLSNETEPVSSSSYASKAQSTSSSSSSTSSNNNNNWIDKDQLQLFKESIDLISVVESYNLPLFRLKSRTQATALCPFHDDHSPSMSIDGQRQIFKCFSCQASGDVFEFVQLHHATTNNGEQLSFRQVIQKVAREHGDPSSTIQQTFATLGDTNHNSATASPALTRKRERLLAANRAATNYYTRCFMEPSAGNVRAYARSRHLEPQTVQTFCLGYAPDVYYGAHKRAVWGQGSLVEHLEQLDFTPQEIMDAGLATTVNKLFDSIVIDTSNATERSDDGLDYSDLMDRFRNRFIVPIMDITGKQVLGFGGRDIPNVGTVSSSANNYQGPKYLNSPETLVFHKSKILFGLHKVNELLSKDPTVARQTSLVIVEGYMDAIALWAAGVKGAVASMGTALSRDQLALAAQTARKLNGKVVLCLDNDAAGLAAMELVCSNGLLKETVKKYSVQFLVARLPDGCKDPAEYAELLTSTMESNAIANEFDRVILANATDWTQFYLSRMLSSYDSSAARGCENSFSKVFERAAEFIAATMEAADRTKHAYEVAGLLAKIVANESNETVASSAVHAQLESDLISLVSRIADKKEALLRRAESSATIVNDATIGSRMKAITMGGSASILDDEEKLSRNMTTNLTRSSVTASSTQQYLPAESAPVKPKTRTFKVKRERDLALKTERSILDHFGGPQFENDLDAAWLGLTDEKWKQIGSRFEEGNLLRGNTSKTRLYGPFKQSTDDVADYNGFYRLDIPVYFNSNDFQGRKYLTEQAVTSGYTYDRRNLDHFDIISLVQKRVGFGPLARKDPLRIQLSCESKLLTLLVSHATARRAMRNICMARSAVGGGHGELAWSCKENEWLFDKLLSDSFLISATREQLRTTLTSLPDCPENAFGNSFHTESQGNVLPHEQEDTLDLQSANKNEAASKSAYRSAMTTDNQRINGHSMRFDGQEMSEVSIGMLDHLFLEPKGSLESVIEAREENAQSDIQRELAIQVLYYTHQWATVSRRWDMVRTKLKGSPATEGPLGKSMTSLTNATTLSLETQQQLAAELQELTEKRLSLSTSLERITSKLLYMSNEEATMSLQLQASLTAAVDESNASLSQPGVEVIVSPAEREGEESFQTTMERIELEFGDMCKDDFQWSPESISTNRRFDVNDDELFSTEGEETVDDVFARMDREYANWLD
ncbi:hypothetical protein MPSEU_000288200 [Mayamaea pseudoterrestris]|nr:hypothetical protein MPSEU_000288200 [Mayamaea pseudoterrestris]